MEARQVAIDEFIPLENFKRIVKYWWVVAIAILLGGVVGFVFHQLQPPVYEAKATYYASIDSTKMPELTVEQYQYDEDISLGMTKGALLSPQAIQATIQQAKANNIQVDQYTLEVNSTIEREHTLWELRYRSPDPALAQTLANVWVEQGYQVMQAWQQNGTIPNYVIITPPTPASLPLTPAIYNRNRLILAGSLIGFIAGIILVELAAATRR